MMSVSGTDLFIFSIFPKNKVSSLKMLDLAYQVIVGGVENG
ncbi:MAG: hypothetical protein RIR73_1998 [Chloroflexota bacterium]